MRVSCLQDNFAPALETVARMVDARGSLPVLANVLLEAATDEETTSRLRLTATNLETTIIVTIGAKVDQGGAITLPAKTLAELVKSLSPERVDLALDPKTLTMSVRCGTNDARVKGLSADDFPSIPSRRYDHCITIDGAELKEALNHVLFGASKEEGRPALTGVLFDMHPTEGLHLVTADGYRLATRKVKTDSPMPEQQFIVPVKALAELYRLIADDESVEIMLTNRDLMIFSMPSVTVITQLIEGKFPDWRQFVSAVRPSTTITVYTDDLKRACKRAEIFARDEENRIKLVVSAPKANDPDRIVSVRGKSSERGDNEADLNAVTVDGDGLEMSLNVKYLIEPLNAIREELVTFQLSKASVSLLHPSERSDVSFFIMPMG